MGGGGVVGWRIEGDMLGNAKRRFIVSVGSFVWSFALEDTREVD